MPDSVRETAYQGEGELEKTFIKQLQLQAYAYLPITSEADLTANLHRQLERLNKIAFSDAEWERFFGTCIASANDGIVEKTVRIQEGHIQVLKRDGGTVKNIYLIDKQRIHNNSLQVINQYEAEGKRSNRYNATVLVNGLPMVQVELKRRGGHPRGLQSDQPLSARQLLGGLRPVRVSAAVYHQQWHADQVL